MLRTILAIGLGYGLYHVVNTEDGQKAAQAACQMCLNRFGMVEKTIINTILKKEDDNALPELDSEVRPGTAEG